jgi:hypothetical protein
MPNNHSPADLGSHEWVWPHDRRVEVEPGYMVAHRQCKRCGRNFITILSSGDCHAVFVGAVSFYRLDDEVTERWLREPCPRVLLPENGDQERRVAELRVLNVPDEQ